MHCGKNGSQIMAQMAKHLHIITTYIENVFTNNQSDENTKSHTKLQSLVNESQIHLKTDYYKHFKHQQKKQPTCTRSYIHTIHTHSHTNTNKHTKSDLQFKWGGKTACHFEPILYGNYRIAVNQHSLESMNQFVSFS